MTHPAATIPAPHNEPVRSYAPHTPERAALAAAVRALSGAPRPLPMRIAGRDHAGTGEEFTVRAPHDHSLELGRGRHAEPADVRAAIDAALAAAPAWRELALAERAAVFLRAAELLAGPWRDRLNAATILGQSKSVHQAEIDAACEMADFWRFNPHFAQRLDELLQPESAPGVWNAMELRPLEGFVLAVTPFNFTAIGGNLPAAPALMGCTVVWKPSHTQQLAASLTLEVLEAAGLPPGVINMVTGHGAGVSEVALPHPELAGVHFTGSTATFHSLWRQVADNIDRYRSYPRLVGETGGKDFVVAHDSADADALLVALLRGAFEYQGQKCSAASRAYVPAPLWARLREPLAEAAEAITVGDVGDLSTFCGAVIDERAFRRHEEVLSAARSDPHLRLVAGGECDDSRGWFVRPTIYETDDPGHPLMERELFGPILTVHPYTGSYDDALTLVDSTSPYALTGAVFATDREAVAHALQRLRFAAGNVYVNDKPTGAVVGQQPFGGGRASGTNDKAGSPANLLRWVSPRTLKETLVPPRDWRYPHMG
jgi:1-pyrroline-5-carboxylate dehydrogenase